MNIQDIMEATLTEDKSTGLDVKTPQYDTVIIVVKGGCVVDVEGLLPGQFYTVDDQDLDEADVEEAISQTKPAVPAEGE